MPISIDGTNISSATIDGTEVQEITIDGTSVYTASALVISATLYTGSASMTLYEDSTGDGVADSSQSYTILDGSNEYDLSSFDLSADNDMWYELSVDNGAISETVEIQYIEIQY